MERLAAPPAPQLEPEGSPAAPLYLLAEQAAAASGAEREAALSRLVERLRSVARLAPAADASRVLHELLEGPLPDEARVAAVEALLSLGFPHALEVRPEDLAFYREHQSARSPGGSEAALALLLAGMGSGAASLLLGLDTLAPEVLIPAALAPVVGYGLWRWPRARAVLSRARRAIVGR
jgi:hypothetical protein